MFYFCVFQRLMCRYRYKHVVTFGGWKEDFMLVVNQSIMRGGNTVEQGTQRLLFVMSRGKVISFVEPTFFFFFYFYVMRRQFLDTSFLYFFLPAPNLVENFQNDWLSPRVAFVLQSLIKTWQFAAF